MHSNILFVRDYKSGKCGTGVKFYNCKFLIIYFTHGTTLFFNFFSLVKLSEAQRKYNSLLLHCITL